MDVNWVAMARHGPKPSQDKATNHINLLATYSAANKPPGIEK